MNFAVIKLQGHQEIVSKGSQIEVDKIEAKIGDKISPSVLLTLIDEKVDIGMPNVNFPLELEVVGEKRGEKIYVQKFHAKARFRKRIGFRRDLTVLKVVKFGKEEAKKEIKTEKTTIKKTAAKKTPAKKTSKSVKKTV